MCGIVGIASFGEAPVLLEELRAMNGAIHHRGPDDDGYYLSGDVGLGMRRLSIIDLETGRQPVHSEDRSVWTVFNGEIYNFRELRAGLEARGHRFYTGTDTEVIVHAYEEYGPRCVEKFRGMFVFAVWDERRRELMVARDRLGIKPLYYTEAGGRLIFASELKAVLQVPAVERRIDYQALSHLFSSLVTPASQSIIAGVRKLEPGHRMICRPGAEPVIEPYWDVNFEPDYTRTEEDFIEELRCTLEESVRLRLISDVPLGAFLSGGVDSSAVVATMARLMNAPVKTFSIGFSEADYSEIQHARLVARHFGTDHTEQVLEPDVLGVIDDIAWYLDEPFGDSSAIPTYMVSRLAAQHVTVVLSGDGGDELFAGYDRYVKEAAERKTDWAPAPLRSLLGAVARHVPEGVKGSNYIRHRALAGAARFFDNGRLFREHQKARLFQREVFEEIDGHDPMAGGIAFIGKSKLDWLSTLQYWDLKHYLPQDILTKVDRMSMAHSIEARVPLLDHKFVELAARIPASMKLKGNVTKHIFKRALDGILPAEIIHRRKQGFAIPLGRWFRGQLSSIVRDTLLCETSRSRGLFNPAYIEQLLKIHDRGRELDLQLWTMLSFELWARTFLDAATRRAPAAHAAGQYVMGPAA